MNWNSSCILITGGSEGIGLGLAKRMAAAGNRVLITGRSLLKLEQAAAQIRGLEIFANDISDPQARDMLAAHVRNVMPELNVVINNAGIQRRIALAADGADWQEPQQEIDTLFSAPVHLNHLLIPLLISDDRDACIVNVTSGGAYIPQPFAPVYSACKAALHSYTMTLRDSLAGTRCKVVELIPPAVQTGLAGAGNSHGASVHEFCDAVFHALTQTNSIEIGYGPTADLVPQLSGKSVRELFEASANRFPIDRYSDVTAGPQTSH